MPTTEIAVYPLVAGSDISDPNNETYIALQKAFETVVQQPGLQHYDLGMQIEAPQNLEAMIVWDSLSNHEEWKTKPEYGPTNWKFMELFTGGGEMYHVDFSPHSEFIAGLQAPCTEIARFFFDGTPPEDYMEVYLTKIAPRQKAESRGLISIAGGITYEEVEYEGVKGKAAVLVLGWESLEAHTVDFKRSEVYRETIPTVIGTSKASEIHHVRFVMRGGKGGLEKGQSRVVYWSYQNSNMLAIS